MNEIRKKITETDLILENNFLFQHFVRECENSSDKDISNELLKKKIIREVNNRKPNFINISKVACFVVVSVFIWECGFSSVSINKQEPYKEVEKTKIEEFNSYFEELSYGIKNLNFREEK
jgi:hypothetical protein